MRTVLIEHYQDGKGQYALMDYEAATAVLSDYNIVRMLHKELTTEFVDAVIDMYDIGDTEEVAKTIQAILDLDPFTTHMN